MCFFRPAAVPGNLLQGTGPDRCTDWPAGSHFADHILFGAPLWTGAADASHRHKLVTMVSMLGVVGIASSSRASPPLGACSF